MLFIAPVPSIAILRISPPALSTFSSCIHISLPSQLIFARLQVAGAVAHHTGSPSPSRM